jgi:putative ABC transport system permease protein
MTKLLQDLRYAWRQLRNRPGFACAVIVILGLGIGATTAIFSAVNPILFEPLPYPHAGRIVTIWDFTNDRSLLRVTYGTYRELLERSRSLKALAVMKPWQPTLTGVDQAERLDGQSVSSSYFHLLGVTPVVGRDFSESEDQVNGPRLAILNHGLWQRRFAGDRKIVGRQIKLDGELYTVIGVMPKAFENVLAPSAELWTPLQYDNSLPPDGKEWGHHLRLVGRLRTGVGIDQAKQELDTIAHNPVPEFSRPRYAALDSGFKLSSLQDEVTSGVKPALLAVLGATFLVLLIVCVNVTNLMLARGAERSGEFAMRAALGAPRTRLLRQLLTESLLLAALGGALGMVVAELGVPLLISFSPPALPRVGAIGFDRMAFAFALGITTSVGLVVGLIPALYTSGGRLRVEVQQNSQPTAGGHQRMRNALVVSEVAIALILLVSSGLLLRSLQHVFAIDPGFDGTHLLTMQVQMSGDQYDKDAVDRFFQQAQDAVRHVPGVTAAAFTTQLPLSGDLEDRYGVQSSNGTLEVSGDALRYAVSPGYFETMARPLRRGRVLDQHDVAGAPLAVVVSESLARSRFPGQDPTGRQLRIGPSTGPWFTIVGVVGNVKQASLAMSQPDAVYTTSPQWLFTDRTMWVLVRARGDAAALTPAIKNAIWSIDKNQPIVRAATVDDLLASSLAERHFALVLFEAFAMAALVLAATGLYGLLSGSVITRRREIGVRSALGASRTNIVALVACQGLTLTGLGVVIGLLGAVAAGQALTAMLFGISRLDPITYLGVIVLLGGVSVISCSVPAWRASRIDPMVALRYE